jgi:formylglycine-generating enzyme required for sulfatase activity
MKKVSILSILAAIITFFGCTENDVPVFGVSLDQWELIMEVGEVISVKETVAPSIATDKKVSWSSNVPAIAEVDKDGTVTAIAPGYTLITAKAADGKSVILPVTVMANQARSIEVIPTLLTVAIASNTNVYPFTATVLPAAAEDKTVIWSSSNTDVATVDPGTGVVTKNRFVGITTITATSTVNADISGTATFVVMDLRAESPISLFTGEQRSPALTVLPTNAPDQDFEWISDDPTIASVDASTGQLTGVSTGNVWVSVKLKSNPDVSSGCYVEVKGSSRESVNGADFDFIGVKKGTFTMGQSSDDGGATHQPADYPQHQVTLTKDYAIGKTEVTQKQWEAVMGRLPIGVEGTWGKGDNVPVYSVTYNDVQAFISKLNTLTPGKTYRLPTEAEWEYAARGGHKKTNEYTYSGSNTVGNVAWYQYNTDDPGNPGFSDGKARPVATKAANELGIYDMSGNVAEWVNDWYAPYTSAAQTDPAAAGGRATTDRVARNGSVGFSETEQTVTHRWNLSPYNSYSYLGFRLAITL